MQPDASAFVDAPRAQAVALASPVAVAATVTPGGKNKCVNISLMVRGNACVCVFAVARAPFVPPCTHRQAVRIDDDASIGRRDHQCGWLRLCSAEPPSTESQYSGHHIRCFSPSPMLRGLNYCVCLGKPGKTFSADLALALLLVKPCGRILYWSDRHRSSFPVQPLRLLWWGPRFWQAQNCKSLSTMKSLRHLSHGTKRM